MPLFDVIINRSRLALVQARGRIQQSVMRVAEVKHFLAHLDSNDYEGIATLETADGFEGPPPIIINDQSSSCNPLFQGLINQEGFQVAVLRTLSMGDQLSIGKEELQEAMVDIQRMCKLKLNMCKLKMCK